MSASYTRDDVLLIGEFAGAVVSELTANELARQQAFPHLGDGYGWDTMYVVCAELADHVAQLLREEFGTYEAFFEAYQEHDAFSGGVFTYDIATELLKALKDEPYNAYAGCNARTLAERAFNALRTPPPDPPDDLPTALKAVLLDP